MAGYMLFFQCPNYLLLSLLEGQEDPELQLSNEPSSTSTFEVNMIGVYVDWLQRRGGARYFDALGAVNTKNDGRQADVHQ